MMSIYFFKSFSCNIDLLDFKAQIKNKKGLMKFINEIFFKKFIFIHFFKKMFFFF